MNCLPLSFVSPCAYWNRHSFSPCYLWTFILGFQNNMQTPRRYIMIFFFSPSPWCRKEKALIMQHFGFKTDTLPDCWNVVDLVHVNRCGNNTTLSTQIEIILRDSVRFFGSCFSLIFISKHHWQKWLFQMGLSLYWMTPNQASWNNKGADIHIVLSCCLESVRKKNIHSDYQNDSFKGYGLFCTALSLDCVTLGNTFNCVIFQFL